jgi:hypothetical protein
MSDAARPDDVMELRSHLSPPFLMIRSSAFCRGLDLMEAKGRNKRRGDSAKYVGHDGPPKLPTDTARNIMLACAFQDGSELLCILVR